MTLQEAIDHLNELIEEDNFPCASCKEEHIQLREWLIELRERRSMTPETQLKGDNERARCIYY